MKKIYSLSIFLLLFLTKTEAIDISATGGWNETIDASDLVSGAGSDLNNAYRSAGNATKLRITGINPTDNWRVDVRRTDSNWHSDFTLRVKRTSDGAGPGSISGGLSFIKIDTIDTQFFSGTGRRRNIKLKYRLTGMSVSVPPQIYTTTITYTVVDTP